MKITPTPPSHVEGEGYREGVQSLRKIVPTAPFLNRRVMLAVSSTVKFRILLLNTA